VKPRASSILACGWQSSLKIPGAVFHFSWALAVICHGGIFRHFHKSELPVVIRQISPAVCGVTVNNAIRPGAGCGSGWRQTAFCRYSRQYGFLGFSPLVLGDVVA
jgi:hypothetical protein